MRLTLILGILALLAACTDRSYTPTTPDALTIGSNKAVFAATSRSSDGNGAYGYGRSETLSFLELTVSVPPTHTPGTLRFGYANPNPQQQFTMAGRKIFASERDFQAGLHTDMQTHGRGQKEITIFVHGFNATQAESAFRAAQLSTDIDLPGSMLLYSWPSKGKPLAYAYDGDSALFARDGLEDLLRSVKSAGFDHIALVAHSMGSLVVMETLRQMDIQDPGWADRNIAGVILMSPDLDLDVFRSQMALLSSIPDPFVVFVSGKDKALNLSSRLRGRSDSDRLGNLSSIDQVRELPIQVIDTTALTNTAETSHFVAASSPAVLAMVKGARALSDTFGPEYAGIESAFFGQSIRNGEASAVVLFSADESPR